MTARAPLRDRVAFALLVPSLAIPITAISLAAWRMGHLDDAHLAPHPFIGLYHFAAMMTLSATLFSMALNSVLAVRNHASLAERAIPFSRLWPHFVVTLVVSMWAVQFSVFEATIEGLIFGIILATISLFSFAVVSRDRVVQHHFTLGELGVQARRLLVGYPFAVAITLAIGVAAFVAKSEILIVGVAILGFLGLPWSGMTVLLWLPVSAFIYLSAPRVEALPLIFLLLAAAPAVANAGLAVVLLRSNERRTNFVNDFLEAPSCADGDSTSVDA